jgi:hypothetical protein
MAYPFKPTQPGVYRCKTEDMIDRESRSLRSVAQRFGSLKLAHVVGFEQ